ncbi:MAG: hypothetical protein KF744_04935 [Taibaiella sp.]|nr:hypothetical protein [Taibaiella sp.]
MKRRGFREYNSAIRYPLLAAVFVLWTVIAKGQSYFNYHRLVNSAERCFFLENKTDSAYFYYDQAFADFDFVFAKDCFMAAQIAYYNKSNKYIAYLKKGFKNGLKWQELKLSPVLKPLISDTVGFKRKFKEYPAQRKAYLRRINWHVWKHVRDDFIADQKEKLLPAEQYGHLVAGRIATLKALVDIVGFPGDRLIGISQLNMMKELGENGEDYPGGMSSPDVYDGLSEHHLFPLLIHYPCSYDVFEKDWLRFIEKGQVHPGDVALLYDNRWLKLNQWHKSQYTEFLCGYTTPKGGYRKFSFIPYPRDLKWDTVDSMRAALFINPVAVDSAKHAFGSTHGFNTEFGYWDCR